MASAAPAWERSRVLPTKALKQAKKPILRWEDDMSRVFAMMLLACSCSGCCDLWWLGLLADRADTRANIPNGNIGDQQSGPAADGSAPLQSDLRYDCASDVAQVPGYLALLDIN